LPEDLLLYKIQSTSLCGTSIAPTLDVCTAAMLALLMVEN